jgi:NAD(P)-dependent dehydrogenase (short-subunit alcohol dehydrogenase family)
MGSGTQPQQARRRLDDYGTRTLVVGALGVIGRNVVEHLADSGRSVVGLSRRQPPQAAHTGAEHVLADVTDAGTGVRLRDSLHDVTHLVFAAYQEQPSLAAQVAPNVNLLAGSLDTLVAAGAAVQHVTLYQGTLDRSKPLRGRMIHDLSGPTSTTTRKTYCVSARSGTGSPSPSFGPRPSAEWQPATR